jgi:hypothetical protein
MSVSRGGLDERQPIDAEEYQAAVFRAFKEVEIEVRTANTEPS